MYGTAWKEAATAPLVGLALGYGFRAIDTANQRKHYFEEAVGAAIAGSGLKREELFLQTKFTHPGGQDHRLPYDPDAAPAEQVRQSMASSLRHLRTEFVDSYVLHGPSYRSGWSSEDREVWRAMEELHEEGKARVLGVSNVSLEQLRELCAFARVKPRHAQIRCFARNGWDKEMRRFCRDNGIVYQGFSLLTANAREISRPALTQIASRLGRTPAQVIFRFAQQVGMLPLTGTTDAGHMQEDLAVTDFDLSPAELDVVENLGLA